MKKKADETTLTNYLSLPITRNNNRINNNNNKHSATKMTRVDASNNPEKVKYYHTRSKLHQYLKFSDYIRNADKSYIFIN